MPARDLYRQFVFASLTGNGDVHAKNISMIRRSNEWRIAAAYDLPSTLFYGDDTLALAVDGSTAPLSRRRALRFASDIGLPERAAVKVIDSLLAGTRGLAAEIEAGALPYSAGTNRDVARQMAYRRRQLIGG